MKALFHISMACCLLLAQAGLPLWMHFCSGEWVRSSVLVEADSCHEAEPMPMACCHSHEEVEEPLPCHNEAELSKGCCSDEFSFVRLAQVFTSSEEVVSSSIVEGMLVPAEVPNFHRLSLRPRLLEQFSVVLFANPPPLPSGRMLRIRYASFLC